MSVFRNRMNGCFILPVLLLAFFSETVEGRAIPTLEAIRVADYVTHTHICLEVDVSVLDAEVVPISTGKMPILTVNLNGVLKGQYSSEFITGSEFVGKIALNYSTKTKTLTLTIPCDPNVDLDKLVWHRWNDMVTIDLPLIKPNHTHVPSMEDIITHKEHGGKVVVIDPGHGAFNVGGKGFLKYLKTTPLEEKDVVFDMAVQLKNLLDRDPRILTVMTRYGDYLPVPFGLKGRYRHSVSHRDESYQDVSLGYRVELAKQYCGDIYLSFHLNAPPPPNTYSRHRSIRGFEVYYLGETHADNILKNPDTDELESYGIETKDEELSDLLSNLIKEKVPLHSKMLAAGITAEMKKVPWMVLRDPPMLSKRYKVIRQLHMPSVLIEFLFITNPTEHGYLKSAAKRSEMVKAVYGGVENFLFESAITVPPTIVRNMETPKKPKTTTLAMNQPIYHTVRHNENLGTIAKKYDVTITDLKRSNQSKIGRRNLIHAGDVLLIPQKGQNLIDTSKSISPVKEPSESLKSIDQIILEAESSQSTTNTTSYTVQNKDTLGKIARHFGTTPKSIMALNDLQTVLIHPGDELQVPGNRTQYVSAQEPSTPKTHKVRSGETLGKIADKYNTSVNTLRRLNGIRGTLIHPGQTITLP